MTMCWVSPLEMYVMWCCQAFFCLIVVVLFCCAYVYFRCVGSAWYVLLGVYNYAGFLLLVAAYLMWKMRNVRKQVRWACWIMGVIICWVIDTLVLLDAVPTSWYLRQSFGSAYFVRILCGSIRPARKVGIFLLGCRGWWMFIICSFSYGWNAYTVCRTTDVCIYLCVAGNTVDQTSEHNMNCWLAITTVHGCTMLSLCITHGDVDSHKTVPMAMIGDIEYVPYITKALASS